jgi:hypothetical protein
MDEKANEILYGGIDMPPEMDNYPEEQDKRQLWAIYESSTYAILEHMNKEEFKDTYNILKTDITSMPDEYQKVFIDKYMDKMAEIYEYEFPSKRIYGRPEEIRDMFKFIEFVEFDNLSFFKYVWKYQDDILSVDIRKYVQENEKAIMDEMVQQSNLLITLTENTSEFLRTYNKEGILEWFINRSERNKYEIYAENLD